MLLATHRRMYGRDSLTLGSRESVEGLGYFQNKGRQRWVKIGRGSALQELGDTTLPVLIYVHGYDNKHAKIFRRLQRLESNYGLKALGFSWPSWGLYAKQQARAEASVDEFRRLLGDLATIGLDSKKVTLMTHSMGNHLLKAYAESDRAQRGHELSFIARIILFAADVSGATHGTWLSRLSTHAESWVISNEQDSVLTVAEGLIGRHGRDRRLGRGQHVGKVAGVRYLDCTRAKAIGSDHSYFQGRLLRVNATL